MKLQGFIRQTIQEIARGVLDAKEKLSDTNAVVNPQDFALKETLLLSVDSTVMT
ncbi:hypothetical protein ACIL20_004238 [Vibrio vulnificus]